MTNPVKSKQHSKHEANNTLEYYPERKKNDPATNSHTKIYLDLSFSVAFMEGTKQTPKLEDSPEEGAIENIYTLLRTKPDAN